MVKSLLDYQVKTTSFWKPGNSNYKWEQESPGDERNQRTERKRDIQTLRQTSNS